MTSMIDSMKKEWRERNVRHRGPLMLVLQLVATSIVVVAINGTGLLDEPPVPALFVVALAVVGANAIAMTLVRTIHGARHRQDEDD